MSDDQTGWTSPPDDNPPPNWGSAYPPPPPGQPYPSQQPYSYPPYVLPKHPQATTAMVLGIVAVAGGFLCYLPILLAPVAWIMGHMSVKEIDANPGSFSGRGEASAGRILGIIGTGLLLAGIVLAVALFSLIATEG